MCIPVYNVYILCDRISYGKRQYGGGSGGGADNQNEKNWNSTVGVVHLYTRGSLQTTTNWRVGGDSRYLYNKYDPALGTTHNAFRRGLHRERRLSATPAQGA